MQRLFSSFAGGWPGAGLLLQRLLSGCLLIHFGITSLTYTHPALVVLRIVGALAGVLLIPGLWTPLAGSLVAGVEVWIAFSRNLDPLTAVMLACLGATLAMIGPGAYSVDARIFGRRRIHPPI